MTTFHDDPLVGVSTLGQALEARVALSGQKPWLTLYERDKLAATLTFGELHAAALAWAGALAGAGVRPGDRVVLVLPTERAFYESYWGILLAGAAPVPAYPPVRMSRLEEYQRGLAGQIANCDARVVVTNEQILPLLRPAAGSATILLPSAVESASPLPAPVAVAPEGLALLQYTSGSTGNQKGVMLTHANLLANIRAFGNAIRLGPHDVGISWLPLYHDMGLIGLMLGSLYWGLPLVALSPIDFLRRPARWLSLLSRHGGTISAAPNFAYSLAARKIRDEELKGLDLSTWRVALCGAEPIHPSTVDGFTARFAPLGLRPDAFFPAYGLAENSLAVCFSELGKPAHLTSLDPVLLETKDRAEPLDEARGGRRYVSVGTPIPTVEMDVVDGEGNPLPEGRRGEIVVRGPSVMAGYFGNPEATQAALAGGWLHTGDLGFRLEGRYYISGRRKDMVIKAGRNYFAEDIEAAAATVAGVRAGGLCAFAVENEDRGTEEVILVAEAAQPRPGLEDELRQAVTDATGCRPDRVILVEPRTLPKTSSGKIQRFKARQWFLDGSLANRQGERKITSLWVYLKAALLDRLRFLRRRP